MVVCVCFFFEFEFRLSSASLVFSVVSHLFRSSFLAIFHTNPATILFLHEPKTKQNLGPNLTVLSRVRLNCRVFAHSPHSNNTPNNNTHPTSSSSPYWTAGAVVVMSAAQHSPRPYGSAGRHVRYRWHIPLCALWYLLSKRDRDGPGSRRARPHHGR